jgi:hypothetical protein
VDRHIEVELPDSAFELGEDPYELEIHMEINNWFTGTTDIDFNDFYETGMMGNSDLQDAAQDNCSDVFSCTAP